MQTEQAAQTSFDAFNSTKVCSNFHLNAFTLEKEHPLGLTHLQRTHSQILNTPLKIFCTRTMLSYSCMYQEDLEQI